MGCTFIRLGNYSAKVKNLPQKMGIHEWIRTGICPKMDATNYNNLQRKIMKHHHEIWGVLYFQFHPGIYGNYDREHGVVNHWIWVCQYEQKRPNLWEDWAHSVFVYGLVALGSAEFLAIPFWMSWPLPNIWSVVFSRPLVIFVTELWKITIFNG